MSMKHEQPIIESVKQIDENSWLFGDVIIERKQHAPANHVFKDDMFYYTVTGAPDERPATQDLPDLGPVHPVQHIPGKVAAWSLGGVMLRVVYHETYEQGRLTLETTTLKWIQERGFGFATPQILHSHERFDRSFTIRILLPGQLTGQRVVDKWLTMTPEEQKHVGDRVTQLFLDMARYTSDTMSGVDGNWFKEMYFTHVRNYDPRCLQTVCKEIGISCSEYVLHPCGLHPGLLVILPDGSFGMTEFEGIGYVPRSWILSRMSLETKRWTGWVDLQNARYSLNCEQMTTAAALRDIQEFENMYGGRVIQLCVSQLGVYRHVMEDPLLQHDSVDVAEGYITWCRKTQCWPELDSMSDFTL